MSEESKFNAGDVVRLKSGGPKMTVRGASMMGTICQWFDGVKLLDGTFDDRMLEIVKDGPSTRELVRS